MINKIDHWQQNILWLWCFKCFRMNERMNIHVKFMSFKRTTVLFYHLSCWKKFRRGLIIGYIHRRRQWGRIKLVCSKSVVTTAYSPIRKSTFGTAAARPTTSTMCMGTRESMLSLLRSLFKKMLCFLGARKWRVDCRNFKTDSYPQT